MHSFNKCVGGVYIDPISYEGSDEDKFYVIGFLSVSIVLFISVIDFDAVPTVVLLVKLKKSKLIGSHKT